MNVGSVYAISCKRLRHSPVSYVGTFIGESGDKLYFALAEQPGVRLAVPESELAEEPVEITGDDDAS